MKFSDFFQKRRDELELSLTDVANRLAQHGIVVSKSAVSAWNTGERMPKLISQHMRQAIAAALEVDVNEMMSILDMVTTDDNRSPEALYVASIVDRLPEDGREQMVEYAQLMERRYLKKMAIIS